MRYDQGSGIKARPPTKKQHASNNRSVGTSKAVNCWICRKYTLQNGNTRYQQTTFECCYCSMPICKASRIGQHGGREETCLHKHLNSTEKDIVCPAVETQWTNFPRALQINLYNVPKRRSERRKTR